MRRFRNSTTRLNILFCIKTYVHKWNLPSSVENAFGLVRFVIQGLKYSLFCLSRQNELLIGFLSNHNTFFKLSKLWLTAGRSPVVWPLPRSCAQSYHLVMWHTDSIWLVWFTSYFMHSVGWPFCRSSTTSSALIACGAIAYKTRC